MRGRPALVVTGLAMALLASAGVWAARHTDDPPPGAHRGSVVDVSEVVPGRTVHVESGEPSTTFIPLGPGPQDGHTLSAQHAFDELVSSSAKLHPIPATVIPYYGVLTDRNASPMAVDVRVWAFATESGCVHAGGPVSSDAVPPSRPTRCRMWEFVNARTGHDLGVVSQEVLPG